MADVAIVLAVDVSASVDFAEFALMAGGLAAALRDPDVLRAATGGPRGAAALLLLFWSEASEVAVPWAVLRDRDSAEAFAAAIDAAPRRPRAGATALGEALAASLAILARGPEAARAVVDLSGDGRSNRGRAPGPPRDLAARAGVVVNALAVVNEEPDLLDYFEREVIAGEGAFAMQCADYADFAAAMRRKLIRELRGPALVA